MPIFLPAGKDYRHRLISKHWPCLIFTFICVLQCLHHTRRWKAIVSGSIAWLVFRLQVEQTSNPPFTANILPHFASGLNAFPSYSVNVSIIQLYFKYI